MGDESGSELRGIRGWLALFVAIMTVITPALELIGVYTDLYGSSEVAAAYGPRWSAIELFEWSLAAATVGICWFVAWRLHKVQNWTTVRITIAAIWIVAIGSNYGELFGISAIAGIPL